MTRENVLDLFGITDLKDLPDAVKELLEGDRDKRDSTYRELIRMNRNEMGRDWFQPLYEEELAERKQKKQDFTPYELGVLCSMLTGRSGTVHEPTAGRIT